MVKTNNKFVKKTEFEKRLNKEPTITTKLEKNNKYNKKGNKSQELHRKKQKTNENEGFYIIDSYSAIYDIAINSPHSLKKIECRISRKQKIAELCSLQLPIAIQFIDDDSWTTYADRWIEAEVEIRPIRSTKYLKELPGLSSKTNNASLIVALDHITDPRNLGAISRSLVFFGGKTLIYPKDRQVGLTQSSVATSQGALCMVDLVEVTNLARALKVLKECGYWIIGADLKGQSISEIISKDVGIYNYVLVLGAEGKGLSENIKQVCDFFTTIPCAQGSVGSLNVSVAAGILMRDVYECNKIEKK